jgi:hypothetical protein
MKWKRRPWQWACCADVNTEGSKNNDEEDDEDSDNLSQLMEPQPFLHTGFEEPMFDPELFLGKDPKDCDFEREEAAHEGCITTTGASLANLPL